MKETNRVTSLGIVSGVLLFVLAGIVWIVLAPTVDYGLPYPLLGKAAPDLQLSTLREGGLEKPLSHYLGGKIAVITVWASWCVKCAQYNFELAALKEKYEFELIGIAHEDKLDESIRWIKKTANPFVENFYDPKGELVEKYQIFGLPESVIVDENGIIRGRVFSDLESELIKYMAASRAE